MVFKVSVANTLGYFSNFDNSNINYKKNYMFGIEYLKKGKVIKNTKFVISPVCGLHCVLVFLYLEVLQRLYTEKKFAPPSTPLQPYLLSLLTPIALQPQQQQQQQQQSNTSLFLPVISSNSHQQEQQQHLASPVTATTTVSSTTAAPAAALLATTGQQQQQQQAQFNNEGTTGTGGGALKRKASTAFGANFLKLFC